MPRHGLQPRAAAFTLIEVLVALALLSLGTFAIVSTTISAIRALNTEFESEPMLLWAEEKIFQLGVEELETGGSLPLPDGRQIDYEAEVEAGPLPDLMELTVEMTFDGETRFLQRLRYLPGQMEESVRNRLLDELRPAIQ